MTTILAGIFAIRQCYEYYSPKEIDKGDFKFDYIDLGFNQTQVASNLSNETICFG